MMNFKIKESTIEGPSQEKSSTAMPKAKNISWLEALPSVKANIIYIFDSTSFFKCRENFKKQKVL